jgi:hypothetical protein
VTIFEPATLVTDYLLGGLTAVLAWRMIAVRLEKGSGGVFGDGGRKPHPTPFPGERRAPRQVAILYWAAALAATAVASFAGGTFHGFGPAMAPVAAALLWKITTLAMGVASFCLLAAVVTAGFIGATRRALLIAAAVKLLAYSWWMLSHDAFVYVIGEYGSTLLLVLALLAANRIRGESGHRAYIAGGILISFAAAGLQQSGIRLHTHFNHNDLMHVVQMGAVWLLYQGGRRLQDADRRA